MHSLNAYPDPSAGKLALDSAAEEEVGLDCRTVG